MRVCRGECRGVAGECASECVSVCLWIYRSGVVGEYYGAGEGRGVS